MSLRVKEEAREYIANYRVVALLQAAVNNLVNARPDDPCAFLESNLVECGAQLAQRLLQAEPKDVKVELTDWEGFNSASFIILYVMSFFGLSDKVLLKSPVDAKSLRTPKSVRAHDEIAWRDLPMLNDSTGMRKQQHGFGPILRYLIAKYKVGADAARADIERSNSALATVEEIYNLLWDAQFQTLKRREAFHALMDHRESNGVIPGRVSNLCRQLEQLLDIRSETPWMGPKPMPGDLAVAGIVNILFSFTPMVVDEYPCLHALHQAVQLADPIKKVNANRRPFFNRWAERAGHAGIVATASSEEGDNAFGWNTVCPEYTDEIRGTYKMTHAIAHTADGAVVMGTHVTTGKQFAVKMVDKSFTFKSHAYRAKFYQNLWTQVAVMQGTKHKNIVDIYDVYEDATTLYIVMEKCSKHNLDDRKAEPKRFGLTTERVCATIMRQVATGLKHMHQHKIIHNDLEMANICFLDETFDQVKMVDFGMSKILAKPWDTVKEAVDQDKYASPERVKGEFGMPSDVWSFGVILFFLLFSYFPFDKFGKERRHVLTERILAGLQLEEKEGHGNWFKKGAHVTPAAKDLIRKCLNVNPAERISIQEVLEHEFFFGASRGQEVILGQGLEKMASYSFTSRLKQELVTLISENMEEPQLQELWDTFLKFDKNGDGVISANELRECLRKLGLTVSDGSNTLQLVKKEDVKSTQRRASMDIVQTLLSNVDINDDGKLSYSELMEACIAHKLRSNELKIFQLFSAIDSNKDGKISAPEIAKLYKITAEEAGALVKECDVDNDGHIDYDEFATIWGKKQEGRMLILLQMEAKQ